MSPARSGVVAVVPARGGSKGLPGKNLVRLGGRPLIAWTIAAALKAKLVDRVLVTTDDRAIAAAARRAGAEVVDRPKSLARDATPVLDAVRHALETAAPEAELVLLLQPTSPLRTAARVDEAVRLLRRRDADTVVAVSAPEVHPWRCVRFAKGRMRFAVPRPSRRLNRQDYPEVYAINGALYLTRAGLVRRGKLYGPKVEPLVMSSAEAVDIDDAADLALAAHHLRRRPHA